MALTPGQTTNCADYAAAQQLLKSVIGQICANISDGDTTLATDLAAAQANLSKLNNEIYTWAVTASDQQQNS